MLHAPGATRIKSELFQAVPILSQEVAFSSTFSLSWRTAGNEGERTGPHQGHSEIVLHELTQHASTSRGTMEYLFLSLPLFLLFFLGVGLVQHLFKGDRNGDPNKHLDGGGD